MRKPALGSYFSPDADKRKRGCSSREGDMLLALRQVGRVENRVTHTNPGRHEKSDMRGSDILNHLYSKNKKKRKGDGFPTKPSILY